MKTRFTAFGTLFLIAGAFASYRNDTVGELVRYAGLSPQDAATVRALSVGTGLNPDSIISLSRSIGRSVWVVGPAIVIADRTNRDARGVWAQHQRGQSWEDIERSRGGNQYADYEQRRRHGDHWDFYRNGMWFCPDRNGNNDWQNDDWRNDDRRNDDPYRNRGGSSYPDSTGPVLGRQGDPRYGGRNDSNWRDAEYEHRMWQGLFTRTYFQNTNNIWQYVGNGMDVGDVAIASHIASLGRSRVEDVAYEFLRNRNWNRIRDMFGIRSDWDSFDTRRQYGKYDDRYRGRSRGGN